VGGESGTAANSGRADGTAAVELRIEGGLLSHKDCGLNHISLDHRLEG
jgi:hypothetical protein